jgi:hypothetical protein
MADKKRKTLQIKRPDPNKPISKKTVLPNVNQENKAATDSIDTDELASVGPEVKRADGPKSNTTRIALPDEDKIRKARRANVTQDLAQEGALPSADQIAQAQKNATMPIMIDTESVEDSRQDNLKEGDREEAMDRTMEIDADALSTANLSKELEKVEQKEPDDRDQTMRIDPESLKTGNLDQNLADADTTENSSDQTLEIDQSELDNEMSQELEKAGTEDSGDQTLEIDSDALATGNLDRVGNEDLLSQETIQMDSQYLETDDIDKNLDEKLLSKETMQMDSIPDEEEAKSPETELSVEEMEESFNAQTMAMDPNQLEAELSEEESKVGGEDEDDNLSQTMDLTKERPKTIMIKRPSKSPASEPRKSGTPTVKAVRPDAVTVRTPRPVTANTTEAKQDTSRIDVPAEGAPKEGKTIKLRRPSGAPSRSGTNLSRVAGNAGLTMNKDGTVSAAARREPPLSAGWLAVAIITCLLSLGAIWSIYAISNPELQMPGRLVDVNNQLVNPNL